jgi:hypothetical protein
MLKWHVTHSLLQQLFQDFCRNKVYFCVVIILHNFNTIILWNNVTSWMKSLSYMRHCSESTCMAVLWFMQSHCPAVFYGNITAWATWQKGTNWSVQANIGTLVIGGSGISVYFLIEQIISMSCSYSNVF